MTRKESYVPYHLGMRPLPILAVLILIAAPVAKADDDDKQEIKRLRERLDLVEAKLTELLAEKPAATAVVAEPSRNRPADVFPQRNFQSVTPPELVPEIGKVGAQFGLVLSGSSNPFHLNNGQDAAGFIDLPLADPKWMHGKLGYEIRVGLSQSKTKISTTSNVAQIANLAALTALSPATSTQNLIDAVTGTGTAPFPVTTVGQTSSKLLQVIPFSFKYTSTAFDRFRIRPYAVLGFGAYVTIHKETPLGAGVRTDAALPPDVVALVGSVYSKTAPFGSTMVAGQIAQSPELTSQGLPIGAGNIDFGLHTGGGVEFRLNRGFSLGFDGRYNRLSGGQILGTYGTRLGFHF